MVASNLPKMLSSEDGALLEVLMGERNTGKSEIRDARCSKLAMGFLFMFLPFVEILTTAALIPVS